MTVGGEGGVGIAVGGVGRDWPISGSTRATPPKVGAVSGTGAQADTEYGESVVLGEDGVVEEVARNGVVETSFVGTPGAEPLTKSYSAVLVTL